MEPSTQPQTASVSNPGISFVDAFQRAVGELQDDRTLAGIEVVECKSRRYGAAFELHLSLDRAGDAVDVALCERIAGRLNGILDRFAEPYTLCVQSAGLDRPLVQPRDFQRFVGQPIRVRTSVLLDGRRTHRGTLAATRDGAVTLAIEGAALNVPFESIESANVEFDIRADLRRAKKERKDARKSR